MTEMEENRILDPHDCWNGSSPSFRSAIPGAMGELQNSRNSANSGRYARPLGAGAENCGRQAGHLWNLESEWVSVQYRKGSQARGDCDAPRSAGDLQREAGNQQLR